LDNLYWDIYLLIAKLGRMDSNQYMEEEILNPSYHKPIYLLKLLVFWYVI